VIKLPEVSSGLWGGLLLTLVLTFFSVTLSLPIGVMLALGRRSGLPVIGTFSILFIELIRGAPLITILFFAKHVFPFFASSLRDLDDVIRMLVGLTLFSAAYNAEIVRGGLQIIPKGQVEAAEALGLNPFLTNAFIILPQAIRAVIPALMSQFVSLFKDTTLVSIIGLFELLGVVELIVNGQARYRSAVRESYLYVGVIYFVIAFIMSMVSRRLEETGSGAARR
jgi:general L-amino acid transport system permease protein